MSVQSGIETISMSSTTQRIKIELPRHTMKEKLLISDNAQATDGSADESVPVDDADGCSSQPVEGVAPQAIERVSPEIVEGVFPHAVVEFSPHAVKGVLPHATEGISSVVEIITPRFLAKESDWNDETWLPDVQFKCCSSA